MARPSAAAKERRPHFFKVFISDCSSKRLAIPPDFCKHIEPNINRRICLRRPRGSSWSVDLVREEGGGVFFQNGWEEFVSDHDLKTGDFLVFKYGGGPHFIVVVFDPTGCEKEAFHVTPFPEVVIIGESHKRRRRSGKEVVAYVVKEEPQSDEGPIKSRLGSVIPRRRRRIAEEEKARPLELALSFRSKHPLASLRGGFSGGWGKFARAHILESDDVLVFELFRPLEVRVHIYRVVEQLAWLSCG
ncbi:unnamed protein product [Spirodela intermedia]|uniref:TF-B3 domain-containing protein n=1 Tax=Spirodela intermedia TaxID=51605 RepID=A0A7I8IJY9_SPIIN|nr:unnamed protein product [Spirodela intermedia]CAA6658198.1 unnamed protein product [Spirodela intermedia]